MEINLMLLLFIGAIIIGIIGIYLLIAGIINKDKSKWINSIFILVLTLVIIIFATIKLANAYINFVSKTIKNTEINFKKNAASPIANIYSEGISTVSFLGEQYYISYISDTETDISTEDKSIYFCIDEFLDMSLLVFINDVKISNNNDFHIYFSEDLDFFGDMEITYLNENKDILFFGTVPFPKGKNTAKYKEHIAIIESDLNSIKIDFETTADIGNPKYVLIKTI